MSSKLSSFTSAINNYFVMAKSTLIWLAVVILLTLPTVTPLLRPGLFAMHDDMQAMRVSEMVKCFNDGQIPCRWVPSMGYGYGYPQFNYYGPLPYYVMSLTNLMGLNVFDSVKLGFILSLMLGNIAMFLLGSKLWGKWGGLLSALIYAYAPYRASDLYSRGAMGESWAFVFIPLIILSAFNLAKEYSLKNSATIALFFGLLICTHNISTLIFTPALVILFLVFLYQNDKLKINKDSLIQIFRFGLSLLWGGLIAGFFFLPVLLEKQFAHTETMIGGYFDYRAHFVTIYQLFTSTFWGVGSSVLGPHDDLSFFFGPIMILITLAALIITIVRFIKKPQKNSILVITLFVLGLFAAFMTHEKSSFIWTIVKPLIYLQFPWRFLVLGNILFSLVAGSVLLGQKTHRSAILITVVLSFLVLFNLSFFAPSKWFDITPKEKFSGPSWDKQLTISIYDYLPIFASHPPTAPAPYLPEVSRGQADFLNVKKGTDWIQFNIEASENATVKLPLLYFPGWIVKVDNKKVIIDYQNELGLITFDVSAGNHLVYAKLTNSPVRFIGNILTLIFLPMSLYFIIKSKHE